MLTRLQLILCTSIFILLATTIPPSNGHGRLIEPPSRASAFRYGFQTPPNYNDHELYCGGYTRQWRTNKGNCGECGDPYDVPLPRPHEWGGKWGQGVIVRKYNPEADITLRVELTASHMGYFEFRICPEPNGKQECLDKNVLKILGGSPISPAPADLDTRFYPRNGSRIYDIKAKLPAGLKCSSCLLQWRYIAGNNWGTCIDGTGAVGCGPQEEFRACADISIGDTGKVTLRPFKPAVKTSTQQSVVKETTNTTMPESGTEDEETSEGYRYIGPIITVFALLIVICILASIYLYHYHGQRVKQLLRWKRDKDVSPLPSNDIKNKNPMEPTIDSKTPPVAPPRTKRLSQIKEISADESSVVIGEVPTRSTS